MCNLYTLAPWEVRNLSQHHRLIGQDWADVMAARNDTLDIYPNRPAAVVVDVDGQRLVREMLWGFPPFKPGAAGPYGTNFRTFSNRLWRQWLAREYRCVVPASAFAEPDRNTSKLVQWRWFERADKQPFFFAGIWRPWSGDRGTKKAPKAGDHSLFSIMTTEPNGIVEPVHEKAMPVMLMTDEDTRRKRLQRMITSYAEGRGLDVYAYTRKDIRACFADSGAVTRREIAQVIAGRVHALNGVPPERKKWKSEPRRMYLYDGVTFSRGTKMLCTKVQSRAVWMMVSSSPACATR